MTHIVHAVTGAHLQYVRALFLEYEASVDFKECFSDFEREVAGLPGEYGPPRGRLLLATIGPTAAGCVALKPIDQATCEMKRLYVRPQFRGRGVGRKLADAIMQAARKIGYARLRLDSLVSMREALALYRSLGFQETAPYQCNPHEDEVFMELRLQL